MILVCRVDKLKNVDGAVLSLHEQLKQDDLPESCTLRLAEEGLVFEGKAEHKDRVIHIEGSVDAVLRENCDRCGEEVSLPLHCDFAEDFSNVAEICGEEDQDGEADIHFFSGDEIDLFPFAEQCIYLNKPMKTLCRRDCKGLCPQCGANLNEKECSCDKSPIDPRLAVLADLLDKG